MFDDIDAGVIDIDSDYFSNDYDNVDLYELEEGDNSDFETDVLME